MSSEAETKKRECLIAPLILAAEQYILLQVLQDLILSLMLSHCPWLHSFYLSRGLGGKRARMEQ